MSVDRREWLAAAGGALLASGALATPAVADLGNNGGNLLYGHGMVWNRDLPGVAGQLRLAFDLRVDLVAGTARGTAGDPTHPDWNLHFDIDSAAQKKRPKGEVRYTLDGAITLANNPANVGLPMRIVAETVGDTTAVAIGLGDLAFGGAGLVVVESATTLVDLLIHIIFHT